MKRLFLIFLLLIPSAVFGQAWSGILDPNRAIDWSSAGVIGDIPSSSWLNCTTTDCNTLNGGAVTAAQIALAIASAPANTVVRIPSGSYTLTGCINLASDVVVRGAGANSTKLSFSSNCTGGGWGTNRVVNIISGKAGIANKTDPGFTPVDHQTTWTAGYSKGTTSITLTTTAGLVAGPIGTGSMIMLDQLDDSSDANAYPASGDVYQCSNTSNGCSNQGGDTYGRAGRSLIQGVTVTAISGSTVTISPGIEPPTFRSARTPGAWWNDGSPIHNTGIENLSIDFTGTSTGIIVKDAANWWIKGVRLLSTTNNSSAGYHIFVIQSIHGTTRSNYLYGRTNSGAADFPLANYPWSDLTSWDMLVENNICHAGTGGCILPNGPDSGNVYAYNYWDGYASWGTTGIQQHDSTQVMSLMEGNNMGNLYSDVAHGPHYFTTAFRNHLDGNAHNQQQTASWAYIITTNNRFFNLVGNVAGNPSYGAYTPSPTSNCVTSPYNQYYCIGWEGNTTGPGVTSPDSNVARTLMRWGNYDDNTGAVRWCAPGESGFASPPCSSLSEVPSTITNYSNAVPASHTLPASFYLSSQPSWWTTAYGTPSYPAVGPDVSGGSLANAGGHATKIPARLCFENLTTNDATYPTSSPRIREFNADTCFTGPTCAPDHLTFTDQPASATLGSSLGSVAVAIKDSGGTTCTASTLTVTLSKNGSATWGVLSTSTSLAKTPTSGVATWNDGELSVTVTNGSGVINANATGLTGAASSSITITSPASTANGSRLWKPQF